MTPIELSSLEQVDRTMVLAHGRRLTYFSGCDYFRLATHPALIKAASQALRRWGLNVAASRVTTGNHPLYLELEAALARFFEAPTATLVNSGYLTNLVVAQVLAGSFTHALIDERAHMSLRDASALLGCSVVPYGHCCVADLQHKVEACGPEAKVLLLTDGMFSHSGATPPLWEYSKVLPRTAWMLVDDAHAAGVVGPTGRGSLQEQGISRRQVIQTITLSKAFGAHGGAILGSKGLRRQIFSKSRMFAGNTPAALPITAAALAGVRLLEQDPSFLGRLRENAAYVKSSLEHLELLHFPGPIVPIHPKSRAEATRLTRCLEQARILPPLTHYHGGPAAGYFRFVISSEHGKDQLRNLLQALRHAGI